MWPTTEVAVRVAGDEIVPEPWSGPTEELIGASNAAPPAAPTGTGRQTAEECLHEKQPIKVRLTEKRPVGAQPAEAQVPKKTRIAAHATAPKQPAPGRQMPVRVGDPIRIAMTIASSTPQGTSEPSVADAAVKELATQQATAAQAMKELEAQRAAHAPALKQPAPGRQMPVRVGDPIRFAKTIASSTPQGTSEPSVADAAVKELATQQATAAQAQAEEERAPRREEHAAQQDASAHAEEERATRAREEPVANEQEAADKEREEAVANGGADAAASPARVGDSPPEPVSREHRTKRVQDPAWREGADAREAEDGGGVASQGTESSQGRVEDQGVAGDAPPAADPAVATTGGGPQPLAAKTVPGKSGALINSGPRTDVPGSSHMPRPAARDTRSASGSFAQLLQEWGRVGEVSSAVTVANPAAGAAPVMTHAQIADCHSRLPNFIKVAVTQLFQVELAIKQMEQSTKAVNEKRETLFRKLATMHNLGLSQYQKLNSRFQAKTDELKQVKDQFQAQTDELKQVNDRFQAQTDELKQVNGRFQAQTDELKQAKAAAIKPTVIEFLRSQLSETKRQLEDRDREWRRATKECDQLQEQVRLLTSREEELNKELERLTAEKGKMVSDHQAELDRLAEEHRKKVQEKDQLTTEYERLEGVSATRERKALA